MPWGIGTFVEPRGYGPEVLEGVGRPLNFTPSLVDRLVEAGRSAAATAATLSVGRLAALSGDGVLDLPSTPAAAVTAVTARGLRLVAAEMIRAGAGTPVVEAADADTIHHGDELWDIAPLARSDQQGQRRTPAPYGEMNLAGETAPKSSGPSPGRCCRGVRPFPAPAGFPTRFRRHAGGLGRRWSPPSPWTSRYGPPCCPSVGELSQVREVVLPDRLDPCVEVFSAVRASERRTARRSGPVRRAYGAGTDW